MLNQSNVTDIARSLGFKKTKIYVEPRLLRMIEDWPVSNKTHPCYDENYRLKEVLLEVKNAIIEKQVECVVLFVSPKFKNWSRIGLKIFYVKKKLVLLEYSGFTNPAQFIKLTHQLNLAGGYDCKNNNYNHLFT